LSALSTGVRQIRSITKLSCDERDVTGDRRNYSGASENKKRSHALKTFSLRRLSHHRNFSSARTWSLGGQIEVSRCVTPPQFQISFSIAHTSAQRGDLVAQN
jgi:hypothetical protein